MNIKILDSEMNVSCFNGMIKCKFCLDRDGCSTNIIPVVIPGKYSQFSIEHRCNPYPDPLWQKSGVIRMTSDSAEGLVSEWNKLMGEKT